MGTALGDGLAAFDDRNVDCGNFSSAARGLLGLVGSIDPGGIDFDGLEGECGVW